MREVKEEKQVTKIALYIKGGTIQSVLTDVLKNNNVDLAIYDADGDDVDTVNKTWDKDTKGMRPFRGWRLA